MPGQGHFRSRQGKYGEWTEGRTFQISHARHEEPLFENISMSWKGRGRVLLAWVCLFSCSRHRFLLPDFALLSARCSSILGVPFPSLLATGKWGGDNPF